MKQKHMNSHPEVYYRRDLAAFLARQGYLVGAEIGVSKGKFSRILCQSNPKLKLYCIDTWDVDPNDPSDYSYGDHSLQYDVAQSVLRPYNAVLIQKTSMEAVKDFEDNSLDFVYIDANHRYEYVLQDVTEWSKKVRSGGVVSGHDYYHWRSSTGFGVIRAVDEYINSHNLKDVYFTTERPHSYFWVKP